MSAWRFPPTAWFETYRETVGGEGTITTGVLTYSGLGDGGRQLWSEWAFGPLFDEAEARVSVKASAEPLRTSNLGTATARITLSAKGELQERAPGQYPFTAWLEDYRSTTGDGTLSLGALTYRNLGDGGRQLWSEWLHGRVPTLESEVRFGISASAGELRLGLGTASARINVYTQGEILSSVTWNPYDKHAEATLSNGNLTISTSSTNYRAARGTVGRSKGKYYFEWSGGRNAGIALSNAPLAYNAGAIPSSTWVVIDGADSESTSYLYGNGSFNSQGDFAITGTLGVAVDLDSGNIWFRNSFWWIYSGNPSTGANPNFSNVSGTVYPYGSHTAYIPFGGSSKPACTANFGGSAFAYTVPDGFTAWDTPNPINLSSSASISLSASASTLSLGDSAPILFGEGSISVTAQAERMVHFGFSGTAEITLSAEAENLFSIVYIESQATISIDAQASTLSQPIPIVLAGTLTFTAYSGDLEETYYALQVHETTYRSRITAVNEHEDIYGSIFGAVHHTAYEAEVGRVSAVHDSIWSRSALAVHNALYSLLDAATSTSALAAHTASWASVGASVSSAFTTHDIGWSSIGSSQSSASSVHHASWDSFIKIPGYSVHEVSWASSGGTAMVLSVHESGWSSVGSSSASAFTVHDSNWASTGASATATFALHDSAWLLGSVLTPSHSVHESGWSAVGTSSSATFTVHETDWSSIGSSAAATFAVHESSWNSIGDGAITSVFTVHQSGWSSSVAPYSVHVTAYQSVVESLAVHHTGWNSFVVPTNFAVHEARYRSYSLDPQFILANAYIEPDILLVAASVTADEDSPYYQCEVELRDSKKYSHFQRDQAFVLHLFADEYHFVVDSRNLSRTIDDSGNYVETATISGLSPLCLKSAPRSTPVTKTWTAPTYASAIVVELIGPVTWNLVDWLIPVYRLAAESADPFEVAQKIVTAAGGLIESQPDGSVVVRHRWPTSIASLDSAPLAGTLYETSIYAAQEQPTQDALMNRIRILDSDAGFQDRLEYVPNKLADESDDPWNGMMYAYLSPWREKLRIATTRGSKIQLGAQGESVLTVDGEEAETLTFESGKSSARYPIMTLNSFEWLDENLGGLTFSAYSSTLEAGAEGNYYGHSLAKIAYTSRRLQVPVACQPSTGEIEAQFLLLENQDGR